MLGTARDQTAPILGRVEEQRLTDGPNEASTLPAYESGDSMKPGCAYAGLGYV
jgi:hypothetical protein